MLCLAYSGPLAVHCTGSALQCTQPLHSGRSSGQSSALHATRAVLPAHPNCWRVGSACIVGVPARSTAPIGWSDVGRRPQAACQGGGPHRRYVFSARVTWHDVCHPYQNTTALLTLHITFTCRHQQQLTSNANQHQRACSGNSSSSSSRS
jgi:hypothetical protein